jgi:hypothetical protein
MSFHSPCDARYLKTFVALVCGFFTRIFFDSVPELWFLFLLFFDPARLARIRVGVWDTSTLLVQVDVNNLNLKCKGESCDGTWQR